MSPTGLLLLPIPPNQQSPTSALISHVSRSFPAELLPNFYLDHRLFVDTSSLLPNADPSERKFTSILTLSHLPLKSYVGTALPKGKSEPAEQASPLSALITIPSTAADTLTQLIGTKLQPQWAHRQSLVVENGTALSLRNGEWIVRIGDLKTPSRANQPVTVRGMVLEITYDAAGGLAAQGVENGESSVVSKDDETLIRGFAESLTEGIGVSLGSSRVLFRNALRLPQSRGTADVVDWELAKLYMDMLRGSRG